MKQRKQRKNYTAQEKVAILRRNLIERVPVSDLCEEYQLQPSVFYRWQQQLFENGASALAPRARSARDPLADKVKALEDKLTRKNEVLSELMEEHVKLKKELGDA